MSTSAEIRALCWRSEAELAELGRGMQAALATWAAAWGLSADAVRCRNAWEAASVDASWSALAVDATGSANVWWNVETGGLSLALFGEPQRTAAAPQAAAPVAKGVAFDAVAALRTAIVDVMGWRVADEAAAVSSPSQPKAWSGAVLVECRIQGVQSIELKLQGRHDAWPRARRPSRSAAQGGLSALDVQVANQPVAVRARMADVTLSLGELMGLRLGDVLVTPQRLDMPLAIEAGQGAPQASPLFNGWLAQRSGHMAVALTSANDRQ